MKYLTRRTLLGYGLSTFFIRHLDAMSSTEMFAETDKILSAATTDGKVRGATIYARVGRNTFHQAYGSARSTDSAFLLGSISKPIAITAFMTLFDKGKFSLEDPVSKYIPQFSGGSKDRVQIRHLLSHVSGLPDQLPRNAELRASHASLAQFVDAILDIPLHFEPGTQYEYSSMGIMLAAEIAQRISGIEIKELVARTVLQPLEMNHSALGIGTLKADDLMDCQVEFGAIESGGGSPSSQDWNWNSKYWRALGAPWGGAHASASDIGRLLEEFSTPTGKLFKAEVARLMIQNQNIAGVESRGLGWDVGMNTQCSSCSDNTFGHTGSTGTIAWADPRRDRVCVILTTLPASAVELHPRQVASDSISSIDG